jgi:N-acetylneuraminate synthase
MQPFIIAEIAQAHDCSLGMVYAYIDAVAKTGCHAIKFQIHIAEAEIIQYMEMRPSSSFDYNRYITEDWNQEMNKIIGNTNFNK